MFEFKQEDVRNIASFLIMLVVAVLVILVVGQVCRYILPVGDIPNEVYYPTVNLIYFLAAGTILLAAGLNKLSLTNLRNLTALFVGLFVLLVVLYFLDILLSSSLWGGQYHSVMLRIPDQYKFMYYNAMFWVSIILGAAGLLTLLIRGLDILKDTLAGTKNA